MFVLKLARFFTHCTRNWISAPIWKQTNFFTQSSRSYIFLALIRAMLISKLLSAFSLITWIDWTYVSRWRYFSVPSFTKFFESVNWAYKELHFKLMQITSSISSWEATLSWIMVCHFFILFKNMNLESFALGPKIIVAITLECLLSNEITIVKIWVNEENEKIFQNIFKFLLIRDHGSPKWQ